MESCEPCGCGCGADVGAETCAVGGDRIWCGVNSAGGPSCAWPILEGSHVGAPQCELVLPTYGLG